MCLKNNRNSNLSDPHKKKYKIKIQNFCSLIECGFPKDLFVQRLLFEN